MRSQWIFPWVLAGFLGILSLFIAIGVSQDSATNNDSTRVPSVTVTMTQSPSVRPSPSVPPTLTQRDYQTLLTAIDTAVLSALDRVHAANSVSDIDTARSALASALSDQVSSLFSVAPPTDVAALHRSLADALNLASANVKLIKVFPEDRSDSCPGLAVSVPVIQRKIDAALRSIDLTRAIDALATHGLKLGSFVPPEQSPTSDARPPNGKIVQRTGARGHGRLEIGNGTSSDVAVSVVETEPSKPQVMIYVWASSHVTITGISGSYQVYFKSGSDWDDTTHGFTGNCEFEKFDQPFSADSTWEISLQKTTRGNASTSTVPPF